MKILANYMLHGPFLLAEDSQSLLVSLGIKIYRFALLDKVKIIQCLQANKNIRKILDFIMKFF